MLLVAAIAVISNVFANVPAGIAVRQCGSRLCNADGSARFRAASARSRSKGSDRERRPTALAIDGRRESAIGLVTCGVRDYVFSAVRSALEVRRKFSKTLGCAEYSCLIGQGIKDRSVSAIPGPHLRAQSRTFVARGQRSARGDFAPRQSTAACSCPP